MPLLEHLRTWPPLNVLLTLARTDAPRGVRETADLCGLSPRGAALVLRRLEDGGMVRRSGRGRRVRYVVSLDGEDRRLLELLLRRIEQTDLVKSALKLSERAGKRLGWIDEALRSLQAIRSKYRGTPSAT